VHHDWLDIDLEARTVDVRGSTVKLTSKEFDLLAYLALRPGHVFSREELLGCVWQSNSTWQRATTVTEHIRRLRAKLGEGPVPRLLVAVRGVGYRFDAPCPCPEASGDRFQVEGRIVEAGSELRSILGIAKGEQLVRGKIVGFSSGELRDEPE